MANRAFRADHRFAVILGGVGDAPILDAASRAYPDCAVISAQHSGRPNRGLLANLDASD